MGGISDYCENRFLDAVLRNVSLAVTQAYVSLHTADPADTGANEVVGGSYTRKAATFGAASGGLTDNTGVIDFSGMPACTVVAAALWDNATPGVGNCLWSGWISTLSRAFTAQASSDLFTSYAHGFLADDQLAFEDVGGVALPTGIVAGTLYWVIASGLTTDAFKVASTQGGAAINLTGDGSGVLFKVIPKPITSGDTFRIGIGDLDVSVR